MMHSEYKWLDRIDSPDDLKKLSGSDLRQYCDELRQYIIEQCSSNPGHLASSLGAVELAVALHYVFNTPDDKIVWDVGHQTYAHKIITGRREAFRTNRKLGGISGFPRMSESPYDAFGGGHASVSISAAFGMAKAAELKGEQRQVVAVIGDGSMTGGLAFEGLNNAGASKQTNLLVILNDNNMAIDQATGALKNYLVKISTSRRYNAIKRRLWRILSHTPAVLRFCQKAGNAVKQGLLKNSNLFESLNFRYFGPIDGHNLPELVRVLTALQRIEGPKLLHVMTVKGKGYKPAECNKPVWHAPGKFNPETGERIVSNVVLMGMGEPLANFENSVAALRLMLDDNAYGLSRRRVTVSTSGLVPVMYRLRDECPVALAVSLHAPNDALRDELVPINQKYPLRQLMEACLRYLDKAPRDFVTFEYVMLDGVNDSDAHARQLLALTRGVPCKFNLIPFNPFPGSIYRRSPAPRIRGFAEILMNAGIVTTTRKTRGDDIDAACGQLAGQVRDKTRRTSTRVIDIKEVNSK